MTRKRARTRNVRNTPPPTTDTETALFLETTAQFHRLTGASEFQSTIKRLIKTSAKVGTSAHVKREFDFVYGSFFTTVMDNIGKLEDKSRRRKVSDMWRSVAQLMPKHYRGGPSLFISISLTLTEKFARSPVTPTKLFNVVGGLRERVLRGFYPGEFYFDKSSCTVWEKPHICECDRRGLECRLKETCIERRDDFLASARKLAGTHHDESKWLKNNLPRLEEADDKELLHLVGSNPNPTGDLVIFWEVPDEWTILSRDTSFRVLQKAQRPNIKVYTLRSERRAGRGRRCTILPQSSVQGTDGVFINYNPQGARIRATPGLVKKGQRLAVAFHEGGDRREGRVVYLDSKDKSIFAVRFPSKK